jgi:hypothetical protein
VAVHAVAGLQLKGHGTAPGFLTGKLSGFAFMIVAPVVCAALLPRRMPGRRWLALLAVTGIYTGCELSPEFASEVLRDAKATKRVASKA